jgi:putative ABC transport system substrate-binding protein
LEARCSPFVCLSAAAQEGYYGAGAALGSAAAVWPLAARAQQPAMPVIGFLDPTSPDGLREQLRAFRQGLKEAGYVEGDNVAISSRWAENQIDRLPELAADLVRRQVAVIATVSNAVFAAKAATTTIPIVFIVADDPVRLGLVASLARPGGNLTGINFLNAELTAKRLELLRELVPAATRVAVLIRPTGSSTEAPLRDIDFAAAPWGCKSRSSTPATAGRSMRPSKPLRASGPTRSSLVPTPSSLAGACN